MSNQYIVLKNCNKIRSWLTQKACSFLESNQINVVDINIPLDIINTNYFKNTNFKKYTLYTYTNYIYDIHHDKSKIYKILKYNKSDECLTSEVNILYMLHTLNALEFSTFEFESVILKYSNESYKKCVIIGTLYNKEKIEERCVNNVYKDNYSCIEIKQDHVNMCYSYNLYSGNKLEHKVKFVELNYLKDVIKKYPNLSLEIYNYSDIIEQSSIINEDIKNFIDLRVAYIIKHTL